ncbi:MAG: arsenate reductase ArsC [Phycisphaerales bacterium]|nr:arsenate reductase ArsC [Phycisphaerales bacterium]
MAEGWARALHADLIEARSAGTRPKEIDPMAVRVMREAGVDIAGQRSTRLADLADEQFDLAVTVCDDAREACPVVPGAAGTLHAPFDDPPRLAREAKSEAEALAHYRRVRDEIREFVRSLPMRLATGRGVPERKTER